jgi:hypothetical protein
MNKNWHYSFLFRFSILELDPQTIQQVNENHVTRDGANDVHHDQAISAKILNIEVLYIFLVND